MLRQKVALREYFEFSLFLPTLKEVINLISKLITPIFKASNLMIFVIIPIGVQMKKITTAFLTTLFHLPIIFWLFLGIAMYRTNGVFSETGNLMILSSMIVLVFGTAYFTKKINDHLYYSIWIVFLSFGVIMVFKNSWIALYLLFLSYIVFMFYPFKKKPSSQNTNLFQADNFDSKHEVEKFDINKINDNFKITEDNKILNILKDIENCKILEVNKLQNAIEFVYSKNSEKRYLTIQDRYFMSSIGGIGMYFEFSDQPLEIAKTETFNMESNKKDTNIEIKKESHLKLNDIKSIEKIFYLEYNKPYYKEGKVEILYKNKESFINSYQLSFMDDPYLGADLEINRYKNIFSFATPQLNDKDKTQFLYSYDDKYFYPFVYKIILDNTIDNRGELEPILKRVKHGESYVKKFSELKDEIKFITDNTGVYSYNLHYDNDTFKMIDVETLNCLSSYDKEKLQHFLEIATLYINNQIMSEDKDL